MDTEFQRRVTVEAAAHACLAVGASRAYPPVLETLADIVKHYVATLGAHAHAVSEHGGRTDVNVLDILAAMKQMGPEAVQWKELREFGFSEAGPWQQPFHTQVPRLPVRKRKRTPYAAQTDSASSGGGSGGDGRPAHVPAFLPPFPPAHTYQSTAVAAVKRTSDASVVRQERVRRKQEVAKSLTAIADASHKASSSSERFGDVAVRGNDAPPPAPTSSSSSSSSSSPSAPEGLPFAVKPMPTD